MVRLVEMVVFTRQRHPANHFTFTTSGGHLPPHCVDGTPGFHIASDMRVPEGAIFIDKGTKPDDDNVDAFHDTPLGEILRERGVGRVVIAGLGTEGGVRATALGAVREGFETWLIMDAIVSDDHNASAAEKAVLELRTSNIELTQSGQLATILTFQPMRSALVIVDAQADFFPGGACPIRSAERVAAAIEPLINGQKRSARWLS